MERYTEDEIRSWPAVVSLVEAAAAFGLSRTTAYEMASAGTFPTPLMKIGRRWKVSTPLILAKLYGTDTGSAA